MYRFIALLFLATSALGWQDDLEITLRDPFAQFSFERASFLSGATTQMRVGRYLVAGDNFRWRGGAEGDIAFIKWDRYLWHMGLNVETLADAQNEINFRLVQIYYQVQTGLKIRFDNGVLNVGYNHRCSHGTDKAAESRITIRSGPTLNYQWLWQGPKVQIQLLSGLNIIAVGQNSALLQTRGGAFLTWQALWPLSHAIYGFLAVGSNLELVGRGESAVYSTFDPLKDIFVQPLMGSRLGLRIKGSKVSNDIDVRFSEYLDSGIGAPEIARNLSLNLNFWW